VPLRDALHAVHRLFDPGYNPPPLPPRALESLNGRDDLKAAVTKPINVSLRRVATWQILDAIALAHGNLSWIVKYRGVRPVSENSVIEMYSSDKWWVMATARPRRGRL